MLEDFSLTAGNGVLVGDAHDFQRAKDTGLHQEGGNTAAQSAIDAVLLNGDHRFGIYRCVQNRLFIEGSNAVQTQNAASDSLLRQSLSWLNKPGQLFRRWQSTRHHNDRSAV